ncbi:MAG: RDD family protein [Planctomycetota bacterium]|jgi:uncharacterized RDD family membrane protein YckC
MTVARAAPAPKMRLREVVTPEGIPLRLEIAATGDRAVGFALDFFIQICVTILLVLLASLASGGTGGSWTMALGMLVWFFVRTFYFTFFELRWQGTTPGKRRVGIRVMDARGGPLTSDAVVVRNLMRELEVWIPLSLLLGAEILWPGVPGWARVVAVLWSLAFMLMPLFNRSNLRVGDMVAGTMVVASPKSVLLADLGGQEVTRQKKRAERLAFTERQLKIYGIYELQVLESLLRRHDPNKREAMRAVATKIRKKIRWKGEDVTAERFLREFYAALRERLERKMLLGKRKQDKFAKE